MPQFVTFQDATQEYRGNFPADSPRRLATSAELLRFTNAAKGLSSIVGTESVDFNFVGGPDFTHELVVLLNDGREARYNLTDADPLEPRYELDLSGGSWTIGELEATFPVLQTALLINQQTPVGDMRWERLA